MRIAVVGLWHLGCVYAASLAKLDQDVLGIDDNTQRIDLLRSGQLPIEEPGLRELIQENIAKGRLHFSDQLSHVATADIVWITIDTPVRTDDTADVASVINTIEQLVKYVDDNALVIISSQLPLGTSRQIANLLKIARPDSNIDLAYSPENLRLGSALTSFMEPNRIVVGTSTESSVKLLERIFEPLNVPVVSMSLESAELTKHALNAFLAMSVAFANEIARVAEVAGANAYDVARGLKSDPRIGPRAYLSPGGPIAGGTLARDIRYLEQIANDNSLTIPVINAVLESHHIQEHWPISKLRASIKTSGAPVLILGLAYKSGTSTLRRSFGVTIATELHTLGYHVSILDNLAEMLPLELNQLTRFTDIELALTQVEAIIICGPESSLARLPEIFTTLAVKPIVIDAIGALTKDSDSIGSKYLISPGKGTPR